MPSTNVVQLVLESATVSSEFAANPSEAPTKICERLYKDDESLENGLTQSTDERAFVQNKIESPGTNGKQCPQQPSELFLQVYNDVLSCFEIDPLSGMVSPPLLSSYGTVPLTVIAPLVDIARHMSNLIVRAEQEVILITCSWSPSFATELISNSLRELSVRAGKRRQPVVVKVMYDKAGPAHLMNAREHVKPEVYSGYAYFIRLRLSLLNRLHAEKPFNCQNPKICRIWTLK